MGFVAQGVLHGNGRGGGDACQAVHIIGSKGGRYGFVAQQIALRAKPVDDLQHPMTVRPAPQTGMTIIERVR